MFTTKNRLFLVNVAVSNKPAARDPEGETIHHDLVSKAGYGSVKGIRVAKLLMVSVEAGSQAEAEGLILKMCDDLRIYNPAAHTCTVIREVPRE